MGKKKDALKDEAKAIRHTEKAAKLLAKKERKTNAKSDCVLDPDIVAMREFQKEQLQNQQDSKGIVQISPNPASNASLDVVPVSVPLPGEKPSSSLCVTFGGEYTDGARVVTNNDLYLLKLTVTDSNSAPNAPPPIPNPIPNPNPSTQYADDNSLATWYKVNTSTSPPPRCSHQTVIYQNKLYLFGGECHSKATNQYLHYNDFWCFDFKALEWTLVDTLGSSVPPRRSGHRMFVYKHFLVLFGGFYETETEVKFFDDLWVFDFKYGKDDGGDVQEDKDKKQSKKSSKKSSAKGDSRSAGATGFGFRWRKVEFSRFDEKPSPRSGVGFGVHNDTGVLIGGFSKLKREGSINLKDATKENTQKRAALKEGKIHVDSWLLDLANLSTGGTPTWSRMSKSSSNAPNRAGIAFSNSMFKDSCIGFGGVKDEEVDNDGLRSVFYDDLMSLDLVRKRWHAVSVESHAGAGAGAGAASEKKKKSRRKKKDGMVDDNNNDEENDDDDDDDDEGNDDVENVRGVDESAGFDLDALKNNLGFVEELVVQPTAVDGPIPEAPIGFESDNDDDSSEEEEEEKTDTQVPPKPPNNHQVTSTKSILKNTNPNTARNRPLPRINSSMIIDKNLLCLYGGLLEVGDREISLDDCWVLDLKKRDRWICVKRGTMHLQVWVGEASDGSDASSLISEMERVSITAEIVDGGDTNLVIKISETLSEYFARTKNHWVEGNDEGDEKEKEKEEEEVGAGEKERAKLLKAKKKEQKKFAFQKAQHEYDRQKNNE